MIHTNHIPKIPRWIATEAGQWAWSENSDWRKAAANTFSVEQRQDLLNQAELLHRQTRREPAAKASVTLI
jgi:hypothetical protein